MTTVNQKPMSFGGGKGKTGTGSVTHAVTAGDLIQVYSAAIMAQPTIGIPSAVTKDAPNFINHLKTAQTNAEHFNTKIMPEIAMRTADLLAFSDHWNSYSGDILKYALKGDYDIAGIIYYGMPLYVLAVNVFSQ